MRERHRARSRMGDRGGSGRARLAGDRWVQHPLPRIHGGHGDRSVAADTASVWTDERTGPGVHRHVRPGQQHTVPARTAANVDQQRVHGRLHRGQGTRSKNRLDAHRRPDGTGSLLGRQRQRPLESGREPDRPQPRPLDVPEQPPARGSQHRDGGYGVHDLEREAVLWFESDRIDVAAGDRDSAGRH